MKTSYFDRRHFLKWSAMSLGALGVGMPPFLRRTLAGPVASGRKLLFIFLRGGIDGIQAVIPFGDQGIPAQGIKTYQQARPTIGASPNEAHDLNGFCSFHPSMQTDEAAGPRLADIFHGLVDERGQDLAVIHRVGYEQQNRSHFSSQQFYENAVPGNLSLEEGFLNRYLTAYGDPASPLQAATLNTNQMVLMKGPTPVPVLRSVNDYALPANVHLGDFPTLETPLGSGLKGAYGQPGYNGAIPYNPETYGTGVTLLESLQFFEDNVRSIPYTPEPDAQPYYAAIADRRFAGFIQDCARLLKQVDALEIVGCNQDGYDTHGSENVRFPALARDLSLALTALYHDLKTIWERTVVMTMSEFGRTTDENGNRGTDHAEAVVMMAMGGPVNGGVYNGDASRWANGDLYSTANGRYLSHRTDFRQVYREIITGHLGDPDMQIDAIIPGYSALQAGNTNGYFDELGLIS